MVSFLLTIICIHAILTVFRNAASLYVALRYCCCVYRSVNSSLNYLMIVGGISVCAVCHMGQAPRYAGIIGLNASAVLVASRGAGRRHIVITEAERGACRLDRGRQLGQHI